VLGAPCITGALTLDDLNRFAFVPVEIIRMSSRGNPGALYRGADLCDETKGGRAASLADERGSDGVPYNGP
jgi:hypothetical protein